MDDAPAGLSTSVLPPPVEASRRLHRHLHYSRGWMRRLEHWADLQVSRRLWPRVPGIHRVYDRTLQKGLRLSEADVAIRGLPPSMEGLRILLITDVHTGPFLSPRGLDEAFARIAEVSCDLVLFGGDLTTSRVEDFPPFADAFRRFRAPLGVFGVLGNHDHMTGDAARVSRDIESAGISLLVNRSVVLRRGEGELHLAGLDDLLLGAADLDAALRGVPSGAPVILLSHNPDVFFDAAERGVALVLSGHTHAGQIRIPRVRVIVRLSRFALDEGRYQHAGSEIVVSRGLGAVGLPIRVACPPEVVLVRLSSSLPERCT